MILQSGITLYLNPVLCVVIYRKNVAWVYFYNCKLLLYPSQSYLSLYPPKLGVSDSCNSFSVSVVSCSTLMPKSHIGRSSADPTRLIFPRQTIDRIGCDFWCDHIMFLYRDIINDEILLGDSVCVVWKGGGGVGGGSLSKIYVESCIK